MMLIITMREGASPESRGLEKWGLAKGRGRGNHSHDNFVYVTSRRGGWCCGLSLSLSVELYNEEGRKNVTRATEQPALSERNRRFQLVFVRHKPFFGGGATERERNLIHFFDIRLPFKGSKDLLTTLSAEVSIFSLPHEGGDRHNFSLPKKSSSFSAFP